MHSIFFPRHTLTNNDRALNLRAINLKQFTCMKLHRDKLNFRSGSYFILSTSLTIKTIPSQLQLNIK